ncbi:uncharacterized protein LOC129585153 isoform X2 [Paramacrobiotus metropolitanus]|uniref:uncharacterized protein LOC129585153 isoform X2 n=1 Tax=Paramacrobiotus metropolitanus TaxID=2943436 RepID=UPI002445C8CE|nr:uncharacterized protein LOC129585153 isoform X2 [Paramacrobiotus metropolitanus]
MPTLTTERRALAVMNDLLEEAMLNNRQDDRVILTQLAPSDAVTNSMVYRPRLGEDATFRCDVPAGSDWRAVAWLHQDRTVYEAGRPLPVEDVSGQAYNFTRSDDILVLIVLNVTMRSGGSVQCITAPASSYTAQRRVLQRYMLLPLITRHSDVFALHDGPYMTATEGDHVVIPCRIRLPLPEAILMNLHNHLMWRHNGRLVYGPAEAPYGRLLPTKGLAQADRPRGAVRMQPPNSPGMLQRRTLTFESVALTDGGYVQCFFRPHRDLHEWIFQTTELFIFEKNRRP